MKTKTILKFHLEEVLEFCKEGPLPPKVAECGCKYYEISAYKDHTDIGRAYIHQCERHQILFRKFSRIKEKVLWEVLEPRFVFLGNPEMKCRIYEEYEKSKRQRILFRKFKL